MSASDDPFPREPRDFSLVLGGPLYQLLRRSRLTGDTLELLHRRILALTAVAWVPLLLLSVAEGAAWGGRVTLPFLYDVDMHVRLLLALPLLIGAELVVNLRLGPMVRAFVNRGVISDAARARFDGLIDSAMRLRLLLAQGTILAGNLANRIFYAGAKRPEFKVAMIGLVAAMLFAVVGPLLVFTGDARPFTSTTGTMDMAGTYRVSLGDQVELALELPVSSTSGT